jgi:hypothetical protein
MYPKIGVLKALKRGRKSLDRPLFAAEEARSRGLGLFSKQFRKEVSANFGCRVASERLWPESVWEDDSPSRERHRSRSQQRPRRCALCPASWPGS